MRCGQVLYSVVLAVCPALCLPVAGDFIVPWGDLNWGLGDAPTGGDFVAVSALADNALALRSDGSLAAWGPSGSFSPSGGNYTAIAGAGNNSLALKSDGSIEWWDSSGLIRSGAPAGNDFVSIAAVHDPYGGSPTGLALCSDGSIVAWGGDAFGILDVPTGNDFVAISGGDFALALREDGSLVGWGWNEFGQIDSIPSGNDYAAIVAGTLEGIAIKTDGSIVDWGIGGDPPAGNDYIAISGWGRTGVALKSDGTLVGWGDVDDLRNVPLGSTFTGIEVDGGWGLALSTEAYGPTVVPVPGAALLGMVGLGYSGWRLRRRA